MEEKSLENRQNISTLLNLALEEHENGDLKRAESLYQQILKLNPNEADALHLLGVLTLQSGKIDEAIQLISNAIEENPSAGNFHTNLGVAHKTNQNYQYAIECFEKALEIDGSSHEAHSNLGDCLFALEALDRAADHYEKTLLLKEDCPDTYNNLASCYIALGEIDRGISCYQKAIQINPQYAEAHYNLGRAFRLQSELQHAKKIDRLRTAEECFEHALRIRPGYVSAHFELAETLRILGEIDGAIFHFKSTVKYTPDHCQAHMQLGECFYSQQKLTDALQAYQKALLLDEQNPRVLYLVAEIFLKQDEENKALEFLFNSLKLNKDMYQAHDLIASIYKKQNKLKKAIEHHEQAITLSIRDAKIITNAALSYIADNQLSQAKHLLEQALEIAANDTRALGGYCYVLCVICDWENLNFYKNKLVMLLEAQINEGEEINIYPLHTLPLDLPNELQSKIAQDYASQFMGNVHTFAARDTKVQKEKIRIGYITSDFTEKTSGLVIRSLFAFHNKDEFEVYGYALKQPKGQFKKQISESFDKFSDLSELTDKEAATLIDSDDVDILIDLYGYGKDARPAILSYCPAPTQCHMLGYASSMGAPYIQYYITNNEIIDDSLKPFFSEDIVYLPEIPFSTLPFSNIESEEDKRCFDIAEGTFVYGCITESYCIDLDTFKSWMKILDQTDNSVLCLASDNKLFEENIQRYAQKFNIERDRIIFMSFKDITVSKAYRHIDLWLDTFPISNGVTNVLASWAGVPILTFSGNTPQSRTGSAINIAADIPEMIVHAPEQYEKSAIGLYKNKARVQEIHDKLIASRYNSKLFNPMDFIQNLEKTYIHLLK